MEGFKLIKTLGEGSWGTAELVEDEKTGKKMVFKKIKDGIEPWDKRRALKYMGREVISLQTIERMCNPYLTCIRGVEKKDGNYVGYMMEFIPNSFELYSFVQENKVSFYAKFTIMLKLLEGLAQLHHLGVVHRDIKAENMLFNPQTMDVRYIDFGGSCVELDTDCLKEPFGSPSTMSPQLLEGKTLNFAGWKKADVWSLGVTFIDFCFFKNFAGVFFDDDQDTKDSFVEGHVLGKLMRGVFGRRRSDVKNALLVKIIVLMLTYDPDRRPSARGMLDLIKTGMGEDLQEAVGNMTIEDIERRAREDMRILNINPRTRIFPGEPRHSYTGLPTRLPSQLSRTTF